MKTILFVIGLLLIVSSVTQAELAFSRHYSKDMVLQREKPVLIRGFSDPEAKLSIKFNNQGKQTIANKKGEWSVVLDSMRANSEGGELMVTDASHKVVLKNVVVGDVILIARQSSIDISLGRDAKGIKTANAENDDAGLRVLTIKTVPTSQPQPDLAKEATSGWGVMSRDTALRMSAASFYLAKELKQKSSVPIGIIDLNLGHHFPIAWMSREALMETEQIFPDHGRKDAPKNMITNFDVATSKYESGETKNIMDEHYAELLKKTKKSDKPNLKPSPLGPHPTFDPRYPAAGYNAVLYPIRGLALKALILQLGNDYPYVHYERLVKKNMALERGRLGRAYKDTYDLRKWCIYLEPVTIPRLPRQWRRTLGDMSLPIGIITPPASDLETMASHHTEMRELQRQVALKEPRVDLILPGMKHIPFSAQPLDESLLAKRSLHWVLGKVYEKKGVVSSGPVLERIEKQYSTAKVFFKSGTADGLKATGTALSCFEVAGTDSVFSPAKASIEKNHIKLSSDTVNRIVHVRYNWREKPDLGLTNAEGLPAIPFRTDNHVYPRTISTEESNLPTEYSTPASEWTGGDVTIVNGALKKGNWSNGEGWLGVTGILVAPFGPNMSVLHVLPKSPADGKIMKGDLIYSVNTENIGSDPLKQIGKILAHAESEEGKGHIAFGVRREGENMEVGLKLEILGTYSSTTPYDCAKTDRIVENMEKYLAARGGVMRTNSVFQNSDALFLMAAGTLEHQGLVRRHIYARIAKRDMNKRIDPFQKSHPQSWGLAYDALLTSEYYLATGDKNVLPFLKWNCDYLALQQSKVEPRVTPWPSALAGQAGGWRHNWHGGQGYGALAAVGLPAYLGFQLAKEAGVETDYKALDRGIKYLYHNGVDVGNVIYGSYPEPYTELHPIDPDKLANGLLSSHNGAISMAGVLFKIRGNKKIAHTCSFISTFSYNNTHKAHGGNFWNNFFTPLGAKVQGKKAFQTFMKGHAWYRDLHRMYDHSHHQGSAGIGGGQYLGLVAPRERLRILGAPKSVFAEGQKRIFRDALDSYYERDYVSAEQIANKLSSSGQLVGEDQAKAQQLQRAAHELQLSIDHDMQRALLLIEEGKVYEASLDLPQLKGVVASENKRLHEIVKLLALPANIEIAKIDQKRYEEEQNELRLDISIPKPSKEEESLWSCLTPQSEYANRFRMNLGKVPDEAATKWRMKRVESVKQAPNSWFLPDYNDSKWDETTLPISWHVNHAALFRSSFEIKDKTNIDALRIRMWTFRQQNIEVYINGILVAKVNKVANNTTLSSILNDSALDVIKNGTNTIAMTFKNNWRWGRYTTKYETAKANSVYNNGVTLMLDARKAQ